MQETMTIKEVEEVIKMKLFTFIADYIQPPLDSCQHVCVILTLRQAADLLRNGLL